MTTLPPAFEDAIGRLAAGLAEREVAHTAADDDVADGLESMLVALGEATADPPERIGPLGLIRAIRDPEVQAGLGVLIGLARALGRRERGDGESVRA